MSDKPYFELEPFVEAPRVPVAGKYFLLWYFPNHEVVPMKEDEGLVLIDFPQDMSGHYAVPRAIAQAKRTLGLPRTVDPRKLVQPKVSEDAKVLGRGEPGPEEGSDGEEE